MTLISAAEDAGVRRIVDLSITNATLDSSLPYFRGKAQVEDAICHVPRDFETNRDIRSRGYSTK